MLVDGGEWFEAEPSTTATFDLYIVHVPHFVPENCPTLLSPA